MPFHLEAVAPVQRQCRLVIGVNSEFDALQAHPVVRHLEHRRQQPCAHPLPLPGRGDAHADAAAMTATYTNELLERTAADHLALM